MNPRKLDQHSRSALVCQLELELATSWMLPPKDCVHQAESMNRTEPSPTNAELCSIRKPVDFVPNWYGDRFIPRRYTRTSSSRFKAECKSDRVTDMMRMKERNCYWKSHAFTVVFNEMFNLNPDTDKVLNFRDVSTQQICKRLEIRKPLQTYLEPSFKNVHKLDWSCKPRAKPLAFIESVHDLPRIKVGFTNIIDWSAEGQIAAIFSKKLVIWTPNTEVTVAYCALNTTAVAFNPTGDTLALATYSRTMGPGIRMLRNFNPNFKGEASKVAVFDSLATDISCLAWDTSGRFIVCGLGNGFLIVVRAADLAKVNRTGEYSSHITRVMSVKFSFASKYLASSDEYGHLIIWSWDAGRLEPMTSWTSDKGLVLFDWHPWRVDEIVVADTEPVAIAQYHVPTDAVLSCYRRQNVDCIVTAVSFNKISGELVVSYSYPSGKAPDIVVLASMDRVVDVMKNHDDVVAHLFWSPDGKQLASAGYDEALTIWNFFGAPPAKQTDQTAIQGPSKQQQRWNRNRRGAPDFDFSFLFKPLR
ncbi:protein cortex [Uranotaenia lowii]|uniref:protein cortex n=1 Tax=Uranotaenia lowii TaxID=190385 RepID=UPI00247B177C|nr:protein cortex [Uranotaenia lowii]